MNKKFIIARAGNELIVHYKNGRLMRIEVKKIKLKESLQALLATTPYIMPESQAPCLDNEYTAFTEIQEDKNILQLFTEAWFNFYEAQIGIKPKYNGADGVAIKSIATYFMNSLKDEAEALAAWQVILSNWNRLDTFTRSKTNLIYINAHLNEILNQLKNGKRGEKQSSNAADAVRESL